MAATVLKSNPSILQKIQRAKNIPSVPHVLLKLIEACNNDAMSLRELSQIAEKDPALASRVLQLVNSAYLGIREPVASLEKAVLFLGVDTLKNMTISASVLQVFSRGQEDAPLNLSRFWWHSLMCATVARRLAELTHYHHPQEAFLSGLLHDIGKLILWKCFPKDYGEILKVAPEAPDLFESRETAFGASHSEVGAWFIRRWHLDSFMADAVAYHHEPVEQIRTAFPLVKLIYVANLLSSDRTDRTLGEGRKLAQTMFQLDTAAIDPLLSGAREELYQTARGFDIAVDAPAESCDETSPLSNEALFIEIKNLSLLYGTLENLLKADSRDSILMTVDRGLRILFDVQSLFFFLYDAPGDRLIGAAPHTRAFQDRIRELIVTVKPLSCIPARSLAERVVLDSFHAGPLSIADRQMIRLLGTDGLCCVPLVAYQQPVGVVVLGVESDQASRFSSRYKLLQMLADHAAVCLYIEDFKQKQAEKIQAERREAASLMAQKVVHEVNNPLGIIKNYLKILGLKLPENHPALGDLDVISKEIDRVFQIVHQLNRFSQTAKPASGSVDINGLLQNQINLMRPTILSPAGIVDHLALAEELPMVCSDADRLKQVFLNLVKNAAEAMPGGGHITIQTRHLRNRSIHTIGGAEPAAEKVEVMISDNGPGIPESIKARLFEPFVSSKSSDQRGLGLSIVHHILQELGGTITVESETGKGTCVRVSLPVLTDGIAA